MNKIKLIAVHLTEKTLVHCACCDGETKEVDLYYRDADQKTSYNFNKYLECCKDKVGEVIDWEEDKA